MESLDFIMHVESEGFDPQDEKQVAALQGMIDSGLIWNLQGSWQKFGTSMINAGIVSIKKRPMKTQPKGA